MTTIAVRVFAAFVTAMECVSHRVTLIDWRVSMIEGKAK